MNARFIKCSIFIFLVLSTHIFISSFCYAQYPTVEIIELRLNSSQNYNMKYGATGRTIASPHWTKSGTAEVIFYPKDAYVNVDAIFELSDTWGGGYQPLYIRANHGGELEVEGAVTLSNGITQIPFEQVLDATAGVLTDGKIGGSPMSFTWQYSWDNDIWYSAGTTSNPCYITFDKPVAPAGNV